MEMVNSLKRYIRAIVPKIVYKSAREAEKYETQATRIAGDEYIGAMLQTDNWLLIRPEELTAATLNQAGIYDADLIAKIQNDSFLIPEEKRDKVVELRRKRIIENFEEKNNYYRMLAGLPDVDANFIYLSPIDLQGFGYVKDLQEDYDNDNIAALTPLHKLPQSVLNAMEDDGYLEEVYKIYNEDPDYNAEYIHHLGYRRVDVLQSRLAGHFELLYVPRPDNANRFNRDFLLYYEEARQYFLTQVYNFHYSSRYDFYEGYMGFFIMVMTIQRMVNSMFEVMAERDFYDLETCRMFLEAYGVPFIDALTFRQQKALVKNLNILIKEKCTSQVFYDILSILEYDKYDLTKYLLVKQHKTAQLNDEEEPKPIFIYRTVLDNEGNVSYELDKSKTYEYYFVGVPMDETDINLEELSSANSHSYNEVTAPDELWYEDSELVEKLQDSEINYVETKYTNISVVIRMQEVMFEHVYLQKILCDKANQTSGIMVDIPLMLPTKISLFEIEIILICLLAKYYKIVPDLLTSPSKSLSVLGFNFDADLDAIKDEIIGNPTIYSSKLVRYIQNIHLQSVADVNQMYANVHMLAKLLTETMQTTTSEVVYHAYKKLYLTLLVTNVHNEVFNLPDGSTPETYMDWLKAYDYPMYDYIDALDSTACVDKINYIATKMATWFPDTKNLKYLNPIDLTVINGIIRLLRWFKSYTIEIKEMEVVYLFDSKYYNLMKMMSRMWFHASGTIRETDIGYHDWVTTCTALMRNDELRGRLFEALRMSETMSYAERDKRMKDMVHLVTKLHMRDDLFGEYSDTISFVVSGFLKKVEKDGLLYERRLATSESVLNEISATMKDKTIRVGAESMTVQERIIGDYMDALTYAFGSMQVGEKMQMTDTRRPLKFIVHDT